MTMCSAIADGNDLGSGAMSSQVTPIAVHVLSGFLGSGKTTLLNRIIRDPAFVNSAVVVNEFGDVGVDHVLVSQGPGQDPPWQQGDDATLALVGGCLCCELRDGLALTLVDLLARRQRGQCQSFERIIIETTGLADPVPILNLLVTDQLLAERTIIGNVLTVVDAINAPSTFARFPEAVTQVAVADQIIVTKTDLVESGTVTSTETLEQQLRSMNDSAMLYSAGVGELSSLSCLLAPRAHVRLSHGHQADARQSLQSEHALAHSHAADIHTFSLARELPVPGAALTLFVQALVAHFGSDLLRVKGFVFLAEAPQRPMLLQGAQCVFHPLVPCDASSLAYEQRTQVVFIVRASGRDAVVAFVERLFDALIWEASDISARLIQSTSAAIDGAQPKENVSCLI